jgi:microcystin-dependent protein
MVDPTTPNTLLAVPSRGSDSGTWDVPVNNNSTASDGYFGGVVTVPVSNANVTLSAPSGTVTPSAGPFQSQNRVLKFTGTLTGAVQVTLPLPGEYTIQNLTVGNFVLSFKAGAGNIVATPQGSIMHIWNDGTDVWLVKNQIPGALTFLGGIIAIPAWIAACTIPPYLLADGSIYTFSVYPALGGQYRSSFGGNGISTFGVQDLRGSIPLAYDGTGTRITAAGCGINGQTMGAALYTSQSQTLTLAQLPTGITSTNASQSITVSPAGSAGNVVPYNTGGWAATSISAPGGSSVYPAATGGVSITGTFSGNNSISVTSNNTSGNAQPNVQPSQVSGIWLVST